MSSQEDFAIVHQQLLPPGRAWRGALMQQLMLGLAGLDARVAQTLEDVLDQADPRGADESIDDWESNLGLPEACIGQLPTLQERQVAATAKYTSDGGQSEAYFIALAASLGYAITIDTFTPFTCGLSRCGDPLGSKRMRFVWRVHVPGPRATRFRCGVSRCGEKLLTIARAADLECELNKLGPAAGNLIFAYEGV
ncbi:MAG TPA: putative phage tail protein [Stellaceae bacterium]|jgi:uncharacterized protein YmfQ (DUF2313 family)